MPCLENFNLIGIQFIKLPAVRLQISTNDTPHSIDYNYLNLRYNKQSVFNQNTPLTTIDIKFNK